MSLNKRPVNLSSYWRPEPLNILERHYRNSIKSVGKAVVVDRAVQAYFDDGGNQDTNFKTYSNQDEHAKSLQAWMDKVGKYFDPNKSTRMPFGFGFYLLKALEEEDRKNCQAALFAWLVRSEERPEQSLLATVSAVNKESSDAVQYALTMIEDFNPESKQRALVEIDEAIDSLNLLKKRIAD